MAVIADATFSRAGSVGPYVDDDLVVQQAAEDVARDAYYLNLGTKVLLLEDTRTNICLHSEAADTGWTPFRATISADAVAGPDGLTVADSLEEDGTASNDHGMYQDFTITADADVSFSYDVKLSNRTFVLLYFTEQSGSSAFFAYFNLTTGAVGTTGSAASGTLLRQGIEPLTDGYYRCWISGNLAASQTDGRAIVYIGEGDNDNQFSGLTQSSLYLTNGQVEDQASSPSSVPIVTAGAGIARSVEKISWPFTLTPQAMTVYLRFVERGTLFVTDARLLQIGESDDSDPRLYISSNGTKYVATSDQGAAAVTSDHATVPAVNDVFEIRVELFADGAVRMHVSLNGADEVSGTKSAANALAAAWSDTVLWLNGVGDTNEGLVGVQAVKVQRGLQTLAYMRGLHL